ncbi:MAG: hypothetical protein ACTS42_01390 [Candidatus Hodgkinia cicadicola]
MINELRRKEASQVPKDESAEPEPTATWMVPLRFPFLFYPSGFVYFRWTRARSASYVEDLTSEATAAMSDVSRGNGRRS